MNEVQATKPKDRIIETSAKLFYGHDAHTIGVDKICAEANVSKRTLYKHFATKEALVSAAVKTMADDWSRDFIVESDDPLQRIKHIFTTLERSARSPAFHGCPMMNTSVELRDSSALAMGVAKGFKDQLFQYFKQQAEQLDAKQPDVLAEQLLVLYDGCNAWIVMRHEFPASALATLSLLLQQAGVAEPA